jgi:hypothetical protein
MGEVPIETTGSPPVQLALISGSDDTKAVTGPTY